MKAIYITQHGGTEVLIYGNLPEPVPGPHDVKIRVRACAVNRLDLYVRAGIRGTRHSFKGPLILGGDVSGDVVEVGSEVKENKIGNRVVVNPRLTCGSCRQCIAGAQELCINPKSLSSTNNGGYAEYVTIPARQTVSLPDSITYEQAASLPTVFLPCWSMIIRRADLKPWETALILSASSGVGTAAIQLAKNVVGARVIATTSTDEKALKTLELGADEVINYNKDDLTTRVLELTGGTGVDLVVDHVGAQFWPAAMSSLAIGGRYGICGVTTGYQADLQMGALFLKHQTVFGVFMGRNEDLSKIVTHVDKGTIRGVIHKTFPLKEAAVAHEIMESLNFFGKLILTVP